MSLLTIIKNFLFGKKEKEQKQKTRTSKRKEKFKTIIKENKKQKEEKAKLWKLEDFVVPEVPDKVRFHDFSLNEKIMHAIHNLGYRYATPIQAQILPYAFKGLDIAGKAQTGTGKTAAFLLSIFRFLTNKNQSNNQLSSPKVLILAPTRELVLQIEKDAKNLAKYLNFNIVSIYGGVSYKGQKLKLENKPIDILVATPGRLLDLESQESFTLSNIKILVIDEADRMLDMGFIPDIRKIISKLPHKNKRQNMLFSATLNDNITKLTKDWTNEPYIIEVESDEITASTISQQAYIITNKEKFAITYNLIKNNKKRTIIFANRRSDVALIQEKLSFLGIKCGMLTGDMSQHKRITTLESFRSNKISVLIATDVASRGIHIDNIACVINYSLPDDPEDYVHRIGRTGRAGKKGVSIIFATEEDCYFIPKLEEYTGRKLNYITPSEDLLVLEDYISRKLKSFRQRPKIVKHSGQNNKNKGKTK